MIFWKPIRLGVLAVLCVIGWGGCSPAGPGVTDEKREPLFLVGLSRVNVMDFEGAIEAFQQALEANPQSAAAHLQLGWLYAGKVSDPAAAIYHYEQFLRRQPADPNAKMIRQQIVGLKHTLAGAVLPMPPVSGLQKQVEYLQEKNRRLQEDLDRLRREFASRSALTNPPPEPVVVGRNSPVAGRVLAASNPPPNNGRSGSASTVVQTHKVIAGDTPTSIARRYAISVESLLQANPGLNPKRMRINQNLTIPVR